jgi:hypothetical protein
VLPGAIADLSALPADAHVRAVAEQILLRLQHALGKKPGRTPEEQEFIVNMQDTWEKAREKGWEKGREKGREEGRKEGRKEGQDEGRLIQARAAVRRVLARRSLAPGPAEEARIDDCTDVATLELWLDQALAARSIAEALQGGAAERASARRRKVVRSS